MMAQKKPQYVCTALHNPGNGNEVGIQHLASNSCNGQFSVAVKLTTYWDELSSGLMATSISTTLFSKSILLDLRNLTLVGRFKVVHNVSTIESVQYSQLQWEEYAHWPYTECI
jgi:hypothetical protein